MIRFGMLGAALLGLTLWGASLHVPGAGTIGSPQANQALVALLSVSVAVYFASVWLVVQRPVPPRLVWLVLGVAVALRLALLFAPPFLSSDIFRYVWDGRVQAAGINPYRYIPDDPALAFLRDSTIFPHINRADYAPTIYPPVAQLIFAAVGQLWSSITGVKLAMLGFEALGIACLLGLLRSARLPAARVLIYAWNPLAVWAFAGNGHIDAAVIGFVAVALLLRVRRRDGWAGLALGLAVATKFLPAVIGPALWRRGAGWRLAMAAAATVLGVYAIYSGVGLRVFGFLSGYGAEEGLDNGTGLWLLDVARPFAHVPAVAAKIYLLALALLLAGLGAWVAFVRRPDDAVAVAGSALLLMAVLTFGISTHYPWYFAWLALPAALVPNPAALWLSAAPVLMYLDQYPGSLFWSSLVFAPALLLCLQGRFRPLAQPIKESP